MKNSGICPKCGGREVISVPSADAYRTWKVGDPLPVGRYLCMRCGYLESWLDLEAFERMGGREHWEELRQAEESDRKFGADLAYYKEKARQEREQSAKSPEETKKKRREDPWT